MYVLYRYRRGLIRILNKIVTTFENTDLQSAGEESEYLARILGTYRSFEDRPLGAVCLSTAVPGMKIIG